MRDFAVNEPPYLTATVDSNRHPLDHKSTDSNYQQQHLPNNQEGGTHLFSFYSIFIAKSAVRSVTGAGTIDDSENCIKGERTMTEQQKTDRQKRGFTSHRQATVNDIIVAKTSRASESVVNGSASKDVAQRTAPAELTKLTSRTVLVAGLVQNLIEHVLANMRVLASGVWENGDAVSVEDVKRRCLYEVPTTLSAWALTVLDDVVDDLASATREINQALDAISAAYTTVGDGNKAGDDVDAVERIADVVGHLDNAVASLNARVDPELAVWIKKILDVIEQKAIRDGPYCLRDVIIRPRE